MGRHKQTRSAAELADRPFRELPNYQQIKAAAAAMANRRAVRRGTPPMVNVLDRLSARLRRDIMEEARAALEAVAELEKRG